LFTIKIPSTVPIEAQETTGGTKGKPSFDTQDRNTNTDCYCLGGKQS